MQPQRYCSIRITTIITTTSLLFIGTFSHSLQSKTITAASNTLSSVQSAVNVAAVGDIIVIPSENRTWSGSLKIAKKGLTLRGKGIGSTIIATGTKGILLTGETAMRAHHINWEHQMRCFLKTIQ